MKGCTIRRYSGWNEMKKFTKKTVAGLMAMVTIIGTGMFGTGLHAYAAEDKEWYVYYNDEHTNSTLYSNYFYNYKNVMFTAKPETRSSSSVWTTITGGAQTTLNSSQTVKGSPVYFTVLSVGLDRAYINATLVRNGKAPASTSGLIYHN